MLQAKDYQEYTLSVLTELLNADSPTGFPHLALAALQKIAEEAGYRVSVNQKNVAEIFVKGVSSEKKVALSAHIDTLGAMVRSVSADGKIRFTRIGGPLLATFDGEYCKIYTREGKTYTGTFLSDSPSVHVYDDAAARARDEDNMYVRLDEEVSCAADVKKLGIDTGCFIAVDTKTQVTESGYIKSRFLDDKAGSACLLTVLQMMKQHRLAPRYDTVFCFTNYEEVGHGAATVGAGADELLAVDMGCVGADLVCKETQVSICAKDSAGPYDYDMVNFLVREAKEGGIDYAVDIYPHYGSDVGAAWRAGQNVKGGLIGPGVHASHGMERTHIKGIFATVDLVCAYLGLR